MRPPEILERERERLNRLLKKLDDDWHKVPRLFWTCLVGLPVMYFFGLAWGIVAVAIACSFVGTAAYLIGVRKREYLHELADVERELARPSR